MMYALKWYFYVDFHSFEYKLCRVHSLTLACKNLATTLFKAECQRTASIENDIGLKGY